MTIATADRLENFGREMSFNIGNNQMSLGARSGDYGGHGINPTQDGDVHSCDGSGWVYL
jgi:hypothetical protein